MLKDNQCYITGNLGRDPEMKLTKNGKPYCKFTIASSFKSGYKEYTEWVPVQVWGELAESCGDYLQKGKRVSIRGRFSTSSYQDDGGKKKYYTQIVAEQVAVVLPGGAFSKGDGGQSEGNFGQFGEARAERPSMEQSSFSDYQKQGEQVPPPKDDEYPF